MILSSFSFNQFAKRINNEKQLIITGYLENGFARKNINEPRLLKKRLEIRSNHHVIIYATTLANDKAGRPITKNSMFEILKRVQDAVNIVGDRKDIFLIIKLHAGTGKDIGLFQQICSKFTNIKIISDISISKLIDISKIVILYDSSVGLETLYRSKHLIIYNSTNRPSYLLDNYPYLNKNPQKGAAARLVKDKMELQSSIQELLSFDCESKASPGLDYLLENAKLNYNMGDVVQRLFN